MWICIATHLTIWAKAALSVYASFFLLLAVNSFVFSVKTCRIRLVASSRSLFSAKERSVVW